MDRNWILAMILACLVILGYSYYNQKKFREYMEEHPEYEEYIISQKAGQTPPAGQDGQIRSATGTIQQATMGALSATEAMETALPLPEEDDFSLKSDEEPTGQTVTVRSDLYQVEIAAQGARPVSWRLLHYQEIYDNISLLQNYKTKLKIAAQSDPEAARAVAFIDKKIALAAEPGQR